MTTQPNPALLAHRLHRVRTQPITVPEMIRLVEARMHSVSERTRELIRWNRREHYTGRALLPGAGEHDLIALDQDLIALDHDLTALSDIYRTKVGGPQPELITIEMALLTSPPPGVSHRTVRRWVSDWAGRGDLRAEKRGKTWYVDPDQFRQLITERIRSR